MTDAYSGIKYLLTNQMRICQFVCATSNNICANFLWWQVRELQIFEYVDIKNVNIDTLTQKNLIFFVTKCDTGPHGSFQLLNWLQRTISVFC